MKFCFKVYWPVEITILNLHSKEISLQSFFYFKLFICLPDEKNTKIFQRFYPQPPPGLCHGPFAKLTAHQDAHLHFKHSKTQPLFKMEH